MRFRVDIVLVCILLASCGGGEKPAPAAGSTKPAAAKPAAKLPTPAEAASIIDSSSDFGEFEFTNAAVTIPMKRSSMNEPQRENAEQLAKSGWLTMKGDAVVLTKGNNDPRFNVRANGFLDVVTIAKKKMGDVTSVRPSAEGCDVDFTWSWIPTEVGTAFKAGPAAGLFDTPRHATATLIPDGPSWTVLRIRASATKP